MTLPPKDLAGVREALAKAEPLIERMSPTEGVYGVYEAVRTALTTLDALLADKGAEDRWLAALSKVQQAEQDLADRYSETTDVIFDEVEVDAANLVGGPDCWNKGWDMLVGRGLDVERLEITAVALGIASVAVDDAWRYAQERSQFGRKISGHREGFKSGRATCCNSRTAEHARTRLVGCHCG